MSGTRLVARLAIIASAVLGSLAFAGAAHAEDHVSANIGGLSSALTAGERGDTFTATLRNRSDTEFAPVRRVLVVRLAGLGPDGVRISRGSDALPVESADGGQVRFIDPDSVRLAREGDRGSAVTARYELRFTSTAPSGEAEVIFEAVADGQLLGADRDTVAVRGGTAQSTVLPSPEPIPALEGLGTPVSLAPIEDLDATAGDGGSGIPLVFYLLGALMVVAGGGILWLLFREPPAALVAEVGPGGEPMPSGYPQANRPFPADPQPTAVLPVIGGRYGPQYTPRHGPAAHGGLSHRGPGHGGGSPVGPAGPSPTQDGSLGGANPGRPRP